MTQQASLTMRARRDCVLRGVDDDAVREALENPLATKTETDPGHPHTVFHFNLAQLDDGRVVEVTWEQLADRQLVRRVIVLDEEELGR